MGLLDNLGSALQLLPKLVDQVTPNGQLPRSGDALAQGLSGLRSKLGL